MSLTVVVPLYKAELDAREHYSLSHSLQVLQGRRVLAIGPAELALGWYRQHCPAFDWRPLPARHFSTISEYNRLLLDPAFYRSFADDEFMLILQPDAVLLSDELDDWCRRPFDYVGAPWPDGLELRIHAGRFSGDFGKQKKVYVGNGGLSLRRTQACIDLLDEFRGELLDYFLLSGSSEDLFFAFMGALSERFVLPGEMTAARFATELRPSFYYGVQGRLPMGTHAWWRHEPDFWRAQLPGLPAGL